MRKLAGELLAKYPNLFSHDFEANKKALEQVVIVRNRALRNQLAGAITSLATESAPPPSETLERQIGEIQFGGSEEPKGQASEEQGGGQDQPNQSSSAEAISPQT